MTTHDRYDNDILKQLTRIANASERIAQATDSLKKLTDILANSTVIINDNTQIYNTADYAKEHPEWVEKIKEIANGRKRGEEDGVSE